MSTLTQDLSRQLIKAFRTKKQTTLMDFVLSYSDETGDIELEDTLLDLPDLRSQHLFLINKFDIKGFNPQPQDYADPVHQRIDEIEKLERKEAMDIVASKDSFQSKELFDLIVKSENDYFTSDDLLTAYKIKSPSSKMLLSSVRRAVNSLKVNGYIVLHKMVDGPRNAKVSQYFIVSKKWNGIKPSTIKSDLERIMKKKLILESHLLLHKPNNVPAVLRDLTETLSICYAHSGEGQWLPLEDKLDLYQKKLNEFLKGKK